MRVCVVWRKMERKNEWRDDSVLIWFRSSTRGKVVSCGCFFRFVSCVRLFLVWVVLVFSAFRYCFVFFRIRGFFF